MPRSLWTDARLPEILTIAALVREVQAPSPRQSFSGGFSGLHTHTHTHTHEPQPLITKVLSSRPPENSETQRAGLLLFPEGSEAVGTGFHALTERDGDPNLRTQAGTGLTVLLFSL